MAVLDDLARGFSGRRPAGRPRDWKIWDRNREIFYHVWEQGPGKQRAALREIAASRLWEIGSFNTAESAYRAGKKAVLGKRTEAEWLADIAVQMAAFHRARERELERSKHSVRQMRAIIQTLNAPNMCLMRGHLQLEVAKCLTLTKPISLPIRP